MNLKKLLLISILNLFSFCGWSQIVITEVHFDTPYEEENLNNVGHHHLGEYIELYNYSNKNITLKGWSITDYIGKYSFPNDAVINSGDFLIIAFRDEGALIHGIDIPNLSSNNYFPELFPNTVGQESKIIYQDRIMLRNLYETLRVHVGYIGSTNCNNFKIDEKMFGEYGTAMSTLFFDAESVNNPSTYDFYSSTSVHLGSNGEFFTASPTPLQSDYLPPIQDFETIPTVLDALFTNYNTITWEEYSNEILFNTCGLTISDISQTPSSVYQTDGLCFNYDVSGNTTSVDYCTPTNIVSVPTSGYSASEIDEIDSKIILHPNPTYSVVNVSWDGSINGKIVEMQVSNSSGVSISTTLITPTQSSTSFDLSSYPTGLYIVRFTLDSGQFISRNIIKL